MTQTRSRRLSSLGRAALVALAAASVTLPAAAARSEWTEAERNATDAVHEAAWKIQYFFEVKVRDEYKFLRGRVYYFEHLVSFPRLAALYHSEPEVRAAVDEAGRSFRMELARPLAETFGGIAEGLAGKKPEDEHWLIPRFPPESDPRSVHLHHTICLVIVQLLTVQHCKGDPKCVSVPVLLEVPDPEERVEPLSPDAFVKAGRAYRGGGTTAKWGKIVALSAAVPLGLSALFLWGSVRCEATGAGDCSMLPLSAAATGFFGATVGTGLALWFAGTFRRDRAGMTLLRPVTF